MRLFSAAFFGVLYKRGQIAQQRGRKGSDEVESAAKFTWVTTMPMNNWSSLEFRPVLLFVE